MIYDYLDIEENHLLSSLSSSGVEVNLCKIQNIWTLVIELKASYKMGTIGVAEGNAITSAFEYATQNKYTVIFIVASGGIRITEGTMALMQMAKITSSVKLHNDEGLLYISIITNPTLGGASASFVLLADIVIAEKGAIFGFSGKRIIDKTMSETYPPDFQTAEYAQKYGQIDIVADKNSIKDTISKLLFFHTKR